MGANGMQRTVLMTPAREETTCQEPASQNGCWRRKLSMAGCTGLPRDEAGITRQVRFHAGKLTAKLCEHPGTSEAMVVLCQPERAVPWGCQPPFTVSPPAPPVQKLLSSSWSLRLQQSREFHACTVDLLSILWLTNAPICPSFIPLLPQERSPQPEEHSQEEQNKEERKRGAGAARGCREIWISAG